MTFSFIPLFDDSKLTHLEQLRIFFHGKYCKCNFTCVTAGMARSRSRANTFAHNQCRVLQGIEIDFVFAALNE